MPTATHNQVKPVTTLLEPQRQPAPAKQTDEQLLDAAIDKTIAELDRKASSYTRQLEDPGIGKLRRAMMTAAAVQRLRGMMTKPVMDLLMSLMNSPLGFMTDKGPHAWKEEDKKPYGEDVVRDCAIEALLKGVLWTGNEFNIIARRCYIAQAGYQRKLQETPGLTDLKIFPGIPRIDKDSGATVVRFGASWKLNGIPDELVGPDGNPGRPFSINANKGSGPDQIVGKTIRKGYKAVFDQIHGSGHTLNDDEPEEIDQVEKTETPAVKLPEVAPINEALEMQRQDLIADLLGRVGAATGSIDIMPVREYIAHDKNAIFIGPDAVRIIKQAMAAKEATFQREPGEEG